jgi:gas vesicle protein
MFGKKPKKRKGLITGIIVGGAIGSVLSLLFASKKNRETAKNLPKKALEKGRSTAEDFLNKYRK